MIIEFDWDSAKAALNQKKHTISFTAAIEIFNDPFHLKEDSTKPEYGEKREKAVGRLVDGRYVAVIYTDRGQIRRIISARKARDNERREYDQSKGTT